MNRLKWIELPAGRQPGRGRQRGAALIIGLILLMVLTVLAISTMRTATLELLMAGNAQYRENAFRIAEAGVAARMRQAADDPATMDLALDCPAPGDPALPPDATVAVPELNGEHRTVVCFRKYTDVPTGSSAGKVGQYHYEVTADGSTEQRGARARLVQGFYQFGPPRE